jgi:hypothetical protein
MCFSWSGRILPDIPEVGPIAVPEGSVVEKTSLPGTLSPCLWIFLEMLCNEADDIIAQSTPAELFPLERVVLQPKQQAKSVLQSARHS